MWIFVRGGSAVREPLGQWWWTYGTLYHSRVVIDLENCKIRHHCSSSYSQDRLQRRCRIGWQMRICVCVCVCMARTHTCVSGPTYPRASRWEHLLIPAYIWQRWTKYTYMWGPENFPQPRTRQAKVRQQCQHCSWKAVRVQKRKSTFCLGESKRLPGGGMSKCSPIPRNCSHERMSPSLPVI